MPIKALNILNIELRNFEDLLRHSFKLFYSSIKKKKILDCVFVETHPALLHPDMEEWAHGSCDGFLKDRAFKEKFLLL